MRVLSKAVVSLTIVMVASLCFAQGATTLPETGQVESFDTNVPPRDDGALRSGVDWPVPRFVDNGDGTLIDNLTGLIWLKQPSCVTPTTWQGALNSIVQLNSGVDFGCTDYVAGSFADWRLPNLNELESLMSAATSNQAIWLNSNGFLTVVFDEYFSSTTYFGTTYAWGLDFSLGYATAIAKSSNRYSWPVRGQTSSPAAVARTGQTVSFDTNNPPRDDGALMEGITWPNPRFIDNGDGTIADGLSGLNWLKDANCLVQYAAFDNDGNPGDGAVFWPHAIDFVAAVNGGAYAACSGGFTDWRLPNRKEFFSIFDPSQNNPALPSSHLFSNLVTEEYWTSTTQASIPMTAWTFDVEVGFWGWRDKDIDTRFVMLVRGGVDVFADGFESGDSLLWSVLNR